MFKSLTAADKVLLVLCSIATAASFLIWKGGSDGNGGAVLVDVNGTLVFRAALSDDRTANIQGSSGMLTVDIRQGRVAVTAADCPNQVCVRTGWRSRAGDVIVCVPNKTVVRISGGTARAAVLRETVAMDTFVRLAISDELMDDAITQTLIDSCIAEIRRIEGMLTDYQDSSVVGRINLAAGREAVPAPRELLDLLHTSRAFSQMSGGAFSVAVGPAVRAWNFLAASPIVPPKERLRNLVPLLADSGIVLGDSSVYLQRKGMALDLGAIGKGYAVDRMAAILKRNGIRNFIVDVGGNMAVAHEGAGMFGPAATPVGIRHPRHEGELLGRILLGTGAISTSADDQRYFVSNGVRYHHLIDPSTAEPSRGAASVTIVAPDATTADALSTLVFVLGADRGMRFLQSVSGVEGVIAYEAGDSLRCVMTPGLEGIFRKANSGD